MEVDVKDPPPQDHPVILHVMVIGFHHKKGSQLDYCYPPLTPGSECDNTSESSDSSCDELEKQLPLEWSCLPSLALPDGAHNFLNDTVFFHLNMPGDDHDNKKNLVYCISCYKQVVASESIREKDSSVTRSTIMKAVVVMSRLPFYGLIANKVESMTRVYFKQQDFTDKSCLIELFGNLNYVLSSSQRDVICPMETALLGMSPSKHLLALFGHRTLILLKLLLLEKKVLFFLNLSSNPSIPSLTPSTTIKYESFPVPGSPEGPEGSTLTVKSLCQTVLTLASLLPDNFDSHTKDYHLYCNHCQTALNSSTSSKSPIPGSNGTRSSVFHDQEYDPKETEETHETNGNRSLSSSPITHHHFPQEDCKHDVQSIPALKVFRDGNSIHPYVCLSFIDEVKQCKACIVGATNALFKAKKSTLFDAFVDCQSGRIEFEDSELKKQMALTTEDLRFIDFLCRHSLSTNLDKHGRPASPASQLKDTDNFEGSDDWLRIQFNLYLLHALRTSFLRDDTKAMSSFNTHFMRAWKEKSENYKDWKERFLKDILSRETDADEVEVMIRKCFNQIKPGHPGSNAKNATVMNDMKLKFMTNYGGSSLFANNSSGSPSMNGSSSSIGHHSIDFSAKKTAVMEASKHALSSAKSTFTSWINASGPLLGTVIDSGSAVEEPNHVSVSGECESIDSAHDVLQSEFNSISFSSLLQKSEDESIEEVVYDRMKFAEGK